MYGGYGQRGCERIEIGLRAEKAGRRGRGQRGTRRRDGGDEGASMANIVNIELLRERTRRSLVDHCSFLGCHRTEYDKERTVNRLG